MNEKLKKIAVRLEDTIEFSGTPQDVYDELITLSKKQSDYFEIIGGENIIKLTFLIYSYKKTQSFELGEEILNDLVFLYYVFSEGNNHREICEVCGGDGQIECHLCDGTGESPCDTCDETGEITCDTCNGSGVDPDNEEESCWDCNGDGNRTCPSCHGETMDTCRECDGSRLEPCPECDEVGDIETDDWDYEMEIIASWNKKLNQESIEFENSLVPIMSTENYNQQNNYIVIKYFGDDNYLEFKKGFESNHVYCFGHDDNPKLKITKNGMVVDNVPFKNLSYFSY
jgi:hypothetical protein